MRKLTIATACTSVLLLAGQALAGEGNFADQAAGKDTEKNSAYRESSSNSGGFWHEFYTGGGGSSRSPKSGGVGDKTGHTAQQNDKAKK